jgi:hypothetical protein
LSMSINCCQLGFLCVLVLECGFLELLRAWGLGTCTGCPVPVLSAY